MTTNHFWGDNWAGVRDRWRLAPDVVHLNHGSFGAPPAAALDEQRKLRDLMDRDADRWFRGLPERVGAARESVAAHVGAAPDALALVTNASAGVTIALDAVASTSPPPGSAIVFTDHVYGAARLAIERACHRAGLVPRQVDVPLDADAATVVALLAAALDGACLVVLDHVSSATARLFPIRDVARVCAERGVPLLVDAAHAPGMLADPLAGLTCEIGAAGAADRDGTAGVAGAAGGGGADRVEVAFWSGNLHKWSCAPRATGALVVAPRWRDHVRPSIASWWEDEPFPRRFDRQGTTDLTAWLAAPAAFAEVAALGPDRVRRHNTALVEHGATLLGAALGVEPVAVADPAPAMRLVALPAGVARDHDEAQALQFRVADETRCEVAITSWRGRAFLRLSAHAYNSPDDYAVLAERLPALLPSR